jgi:lipopolysaccharide transport system ATP-binding protein
VAFSELGDFIHKPVKTYSSGMYVRLAFSISISLDPDILIIDEALAVGDVKFQRKCFRKLEQLRNQGVTILFVTHATESVVAMCDRALLLDGGEVMTLGDPKRVVNQYLESMFFPGANANQKPGAGGQYTRLHGNRLIMEPDVDSCKRRATYNDSEYRWGSGEAQIVDYLLLAEDGKEIITGCQSGQPLTLRLGVFFHQPASGLTYGFTIKTIGGAAVFGTNSELKGTQIENKGGNEFTVVEFSFCAHLIPGEYFISVGVVIREESGPETALDRRYDLLHLKIHEDKRDAFGIAAVDMKITELPTEVLTEEERQ